MKPGTEFVVDKVLKFQLRSIAISKVLKLGLYDVILYSC
jgi:hypothetical protein